MEFVLRAKFALPSMRAALLASGSAVLLEHNEVVGRDTFWSDNYDGSGQNRLGRLLMLLRKELAPHSWPPLLVSANKSGGFFCFAFLLVLIDSVFADR